VTTLAGLGRSSGTNDGRGTTARFDLPASVAVDTNGNVYVGALGNDTIRMLTLTGTNWVVTTLGGVPGVAGTNDGTGSAARFNSPAGVAVDNAGDIYVGDENNDTIREGFKPTLAPTILSQPQSLSVTIGNSATFTVTASGASPLAYQWQFNNTNLTDGAQITGSQSNVLTLSSVTLANAGTYQVIVTNVYGSTNASATLSALTVGTWTPLAHLAPNGIETMLLLSDGTVMGQNGGGTGWYRLTPGATGGYANGTWTSDIASMHYTRLYYSSDVLPDGRVFVAGGEYGTGTTNAEVYSPVSNTWTLIPIPSGFITTNNTVGSDGGNDAGFMDSPSVVLSNGKVLVAPIVPVNSGETGIYDPVANSWSTAKLYRGNNEDEASLVMLPDNSILVVDFGTQNSERYIPSQNQWINDATVPVSLYDSYGYELGPAFLLPNGKTLQIGSAPHFGIYTPTGNTTPGMWAGGSMPNNLGAPDAPAAMMVNGKVLCALSPTPSSGNVFTTPSYLYEYDYSAGSLGTFTQVLAPGGGYSINEVTFDDRMLVLPDGKVLFTDGGNQLYVYTPYGAPLAAGQPGISNLAKNADGSYLLAGTQLNGISQGAAYGDDAQMNSNYPLVRMTNTTTGIVYYARTYNWSSTGVMTGTNIVTTEFALPASAPTGTYSLVVVANGNPSAPLPFTVGMPQTNPIITWATPAPITYGTALSSNQLDATANVPGSFAYNPTNGAVLNAGTNTLSVIFTPVNKADYKSVTNTVSLVVLPAPLTVTAFNAIRLMGATNPVFTGTVTGVTNGDNITAVYSSSATTNSAAGTYSITPTLVDPGSRLGNYQVTVVNGTLTVIVPPFIQSAQQSGGAFTFTWSAITNQMYEIQFTTNLAPANWIISGGPITATNTSMTFSQPIGANSQLFYRVVLVP